ncbi:MAG: ribbon-helix-helix domain-containing protein [Candidatus Woesearchaeota archaeon]
MVRKTETVNVRVPDELAGWLDELVDKKIFSSRSEVVRHFLREYVQDQKRQNFQQSSKNKREGNI